MIPSRTHRCRNGALVLVWPGRTEVRLAGSGALVAGAPQHNAEQAATAVELGYGADVERMVEDHDPLHAMLADWLSVGDSPALRVAAGELPEGDLLADIEEAAVLAVQRYMVATGGKLPMRGEAQERRNPRTMLIKRPGLPPAGDAATFIGFDENREPWVLRWNAAAGCWMGMGFKPPDPDFDGTLPVPQAFLAREDMAGFIVAHVSAAEIGQ